MTKHLRVIAPSSSLLSVSLEQCKKAEAFLTSNGWSVSFAEGVYHVNDGTQATLAQKAQDLNVALEDSKVTHIMAAKGGWNSHEILPYIDWDLWKKCRKPLIGYSDTTTLLNAAYTQSEVNSVHSMHFSNLADESSLVQKSYSNLAASLSDASYDLNMCSQEFGSPVGIRYGETCGRALGGNLTSFMLLAGTRYFPNLEDAVIFVEDVPAIHIGAFRRALVQLCSQQGAEYIKGIVFGRLCSDNYSVDSQFRAVIEQVMSADIPIICNVSFGHTRPVNSFMIGERVTLKVSPNQTSIVVNRKPR